jgi:hypothetical protein
MLVFGSAVYDLWKARNVIRFCGVSSTECKFLRGYFGKLEPDFLEKVLLRSLEKTI